jgi:hypothetical protein
VIFHSYVSLPEGTLASKKLTQPLTQPWEIQACLVSC